VIDRANANLPARDFGATADFYGRMGFVVAYRDDHWMILTRGPLELEFFPHPDLDPGQSWFSACIRVEAPDTLLDDWRRLGLPSDNTSIPRLTGFFKTGQAPRMFALVDPDGSLLRVIDNKD